MRRTLGLCFMLCMVLAVMAGLWLTESEAQANGMGAGGGDVPTYLVPDAKFDVLGLVDANRAQISSSTPGDGALRNVWDGSRDTGFVTANNPGWVQVSFNDPRTMQRFRTYFDRYFVEYASCNTVYVDWSVVDGDTGAIIVPTQRACLRQWSEYVLPSPVKANRLKLNFQITGGNLPALHEWELFGEAGINSFSVAPAVNVPMVVGDTRQFKAPAHNNALNENYDIARSVNWSVTGGVGSFSKEFLTATAPGAGLVRATLGTLLSTNSIPVTVKARNIAADIDVLLIERTPRLAFDPNDLSYGSGWPTPGQTVTYKAHVKNWGTASVLLPYRWSFDGITPGQPSYVSINPGQTVEIDFPWTWPSDGQ
ncbi:MAG: hypothetical protein JO360_17895, partial [Acidobacteria bacterium]|nr:hypothetical protein [Acidobacteriota bacterium]